MNEILLDNGTSYIVVMDCVYKNKKYLYLINRIKYNDIKIVEMIDDVTLIMVDDENLLKEIIGQFTFLINTIFN